MDRDFIIKGDGILPAISGEYPGVDAPGRLYEALCDIWCEETCAPRMRRDWNEANKSLGQCSVTAFLFRDIFGGDVYGLWLKSGDLHCFNVARGQVFDLTCGQLEEDPDYSRCFIQKREDHFAKKEKYDRYLLLKRRLREYCIQKGAE